MRLAITLALATVALATAGTASATSALKPANLNAWWRGYLAGPVAVKSCQASGITFLCRVVNPIDNGVLAFAGLARSSACLYEYVVREAGESHLLTRTFRFCG